MRYEKTLSGNVGEIEVGSYPAVRYVAQDPSIGSSLFISYTTPSDFVLVPKNASMVEFNLEGALKSWGFSTRSFVDAVKTSVGKITFKLEGEGTVIYAIRLPKSLIPKNVRIEGAGEGSDWRYAFDTLLLIINHSSPVVVIVEFETVVSLILGFTSALIALSLLTSIFKPVIKRIVRRK